MNRLFTLSLILPLGSFAQKTAHLATHRTPTRYLANSQLSIDISTAAYFQKQYFYKSLYPGPNMQLVYAPNRNWKLTGQSFFSLSDNLRNQWLKSGITDNNTQLLRNSQLSVTVIRQLTARTSMKNRGGATSDGLRKASWELRAGYFYTQQSWFWDLSYHQFGELPSGEPIYVTGYRAHSATIGIDYNTLRIRTKTTIQHHVYADLLVGVHQSLQSAYLDTTQVYRKYGIDEHFQRQTFGTRIGYEYRLYGKGHWGFVTGIEAQLRPIVDYRSNSQYYAPRGAEGLHREAVMVKAGITYRL